jgi:hypothetical protein
VPRESGERRRDKVWKREQAFGESVRRPAVELMGRRKLQVILAACGMLTAATDLHDVLCIFAILAAIFIIA